MRVEMQQIQLSVPLGKRAHDRIADGMIAAEHEQARRRCERRATRFAIASIGARLPALAGTLRSP